MLSFAAFLQTGLDNHFFLLRDDLRIHNSVDDLDVGIISPQGGMNSIELIAADVVLLAVRRYSILITITSTRGTAEVGAPRCSSTSATIEKTRASLALNSKGRSGLISFG
jgi:hypothetical protein